MRISPLLIAAAVLLAAATPIYAPAQVESTPIPAPKKVNFSSMSFLVGNWTCSTKSARRPSAYITTMSYTMDPSGWWMDVTSFVTPNKWIPTKFTTSDKITYDSDTHRWVDVSYGTPNTYGLSFSSGWSGNKMVWHDVSFAPTADISSQTDNTITKVSDAKTTSSSSFTEAKTGRVVSVTGICTKH